MGDRCRGQGASSAQGVGRLFWKKRSDPCWASFPLRLPDAPRPSPILLVPREPGIAGPPGGRQVSPEASPICPALKTIPSPSPSDPGGTGAPLLPALPTAPVLLLFPPPMDTCVNIPLPDSSQNTQFECDTFSSSQDLLCPAPFPRFAGSGCSQGREDMGLSSVDTPAGQGKQPHGGVGRGRPFAPLRGAGWGCPLS